MNDVQESRLSMFLTARDFLLQNAAITTPLPNFSAFMSTFQSTITQIQSIAEKQQFDRSGISESKEQARQILTDEMLEYSRRMVAYSQFVNNLTLQAEAKTSATVLKREPDTILRDIAQRLYDRAAANLQGLEAYGITASTQTAFLTAINNFNTSIPKPRLGITEKKQATTQLTTLFKTAVDALNHISILIETIRISQPVFYSGFKTARKLIVTGKGSLSLHGVVVEREEGEPVSGALIRISNHGTGIKGSAKEVLIDKKSADKGGFIVKSLAEGHYSVTVSKPGFKTTELPFVVDGEEMTNLEVHLEKE